MCNSTSDDCISRLLHLFSLNFLIFFASSSHDVQYLVYFALISLSHPYPWHALARVSNFMNKDKLRLLGKAFIVSQFSYYPLVWMFHSRTLNNKINKLHDRALRLVYKGDKLSFQQLLWIIHFSTYHRNLQKTCYRNI